jgi:hypothetical protein
VAEFTDFALDNEFDVENKPTLIGQKYKGKRAEPAVVLLNLSAFL